MSVGIDFVHDAGMRHGAGCVKAPFKKLMTLSIYKQMQMFISDV